LTATAFQYFAHAGAKFVVLEVGMGGRLDATNVTDPRVALITNIDFDHMEFLGSTLAAIAAEKAGIIKPHRAGDIRRGKYGSRRRHSPPRGGVRSGVAGTERTWRKSPIFTPNRAATHSIWRFGQERFARLTCPLLGKFQVKNTVAAVAGAWRLEAEGFEISRRSILQGLHSATWPGRLEPISPSRWCCSMAGTTPAPRANWPRSSGKSFPDAAAPGVRFHAR
jgi:dihydrofolate synthase/folylpolyglutamate synthase